MTHRGPITTPGMTDHEILMELHLRMRVVEASCEKLSAQAHTERAQLLKANRMQGETIIRLIRSKEQLMELVGRIVIEAQHPLVITGAPLPLEVSPEMAADIRRALDEINKPMAQRQ